MIHLARDGSRFRADALAAAQPLLRTIAVLHSALVAMPHPVGGAAIEAVARLTPREREVASLAAGGYGALQIAARLGTSIHTVRRQLESIHRKCGVANRADLTTLMRRAGADVAADASPLQRGLARLLGSVGLTSAVHPEVWRALA